MQSRKAGGLVSGCRLRMLLVVVATLAAVWLVLNLTLGNKQLDTQVQRLYAVSDDQFPRAMATLLGAPLTDGNHVEPLLNGEQAFPAMLQAIREARESITLESYIFWSGDIGSEFTEALNERARHGVRVHVLLDWIGGKLDDRLLEHMRANGVEVRRYNSPNWYNLHRLNNRTHRKLLVVDGAVAFTGGIGIADEWRGGGDRPGRWRDTHFRVRGPAVLQMQAAFADNWMQATGEVLHGARYLPAPRAAGSARAQVFTSAPGGGAESMQLMYLLSIAAAATSIDISASYFVPDNVAVNALLAALARGVRLRMIVPGPHMDRPIVRRASRHGWGKLLRAGAEIHEFEPTMYHVKAMVVDNVWVSVGSTNIDNRSFSINDEANLNVYDEPFAAVQTGAFEQDLRQARRITLREWQERSAIDKLLDFGASLFSAQL